VLAFTQYADPFEEVPRTNAAIDGRAAELGRAWSRTDLNDATLLEALLPGNDVLLIYEQETGDPATMDVVGASWAGVLREFLAGGGVVVACDFTWPGSATQHLVTGARLMDISSSAAVSLGTTLAIVDPGSPLVQGIAGATYAASNGTSSYATSSEGAVVTTTAGDPVVIHRLYSRGGADFYALPYDFWQWDAPAAALLQRAVTYEFPATPAVGVVQSCVDTSTPVNGANPVGPIDRGEYYATIAALEYAGFPAANVIEIADAADAAARAGSYEVLLFPEQELCTVPSADWIGVISDLVASGGRVVAMGSDAAFVDGLGLFGAGSTVWSDPSATFVSTPDPFWSGITHPGWLDATWTWAWAGPGLVALGHASTDASALSVWGYSVD
jgi:hypothetical protein